MQQSKKDTVKDHGVSLSGVVINKYMLSSVWCHVHVLHPESTGRQLIGQESSKYTTLFFSVFITKKQKKVSLFTLQENKKIQ